MHKLRLELKYVLNDLLWDGNMDYGWEDLSRYVITSSQKFAKVMLEIVDFSPVLESRELISPLCMERFEGLVGILANAVREGEFFAYEDSDENVQNVLKLNGWILLGSLTESILQMFLAFYLDDYKKTKWMQWEEFEKEKVIQPISECVQNLVSENILTAKQARSIKDAVKEKIKEHTQEHPVQKIMLDELIKLYQHLELMNEDELTYLKGIQANRNGIHSFQNRKLGTWFDFKYSVRFFCYLMDWVAFHLPDVPDYN